MSWLFSTFLKTGNNKKKLIIDAISKIAILWKNEMNINIADLMKKKLFRPHFHNDASVREGECDLCDISPAMPHCRSIAIRSDVIP
jgi:hypothetical protein